MWVGIHADMNKDIKMRLEKTILQDAAGGAVTVREMTVGEMRDWIADSARLVTSDFDLAVADAIADGELMPADIYHLSSLTAETLNAYTPSELCQVTTLIRELNGCFFALLGRRQDLWTPKRYYAVLNSLPAASHEEATAAASGSSPTEPSLSP